MCNYEPGSLLSEFLNSAFAGSLFSFISAYILYRYSKKHDLWMAHKRATVATSELVNRHLNEMYDNLFLMEGDLNALAVTNGFSYNELHQIPMPDYKTDFQNIDLKNKFMDYETEIIKLNYDMQSINRAIKGLWDARLSGKLDPVSEKTNREHLIKQIKTVHRSLNLSIKETFNLGAYLRVFIRKDNFDITGNLKKTNNIKVTEKELTIARKEFFRESEQTKKNSKEKIEKIQKSN